jgi:predicted deacylase
LFRPDVIRTAGKNQILKRTGTLSSYLKIRGIPYVLLEMPLHTKTSKEQIDRIVSGILLHLHEKKDPTNAVSDEFDILPKVGIRLIKADAAGVFVKNAGLVLGQKIAEGDSVGEIITEETRLIIRSPYSGMICEMDRDERREVALNDTLLGIGEWV